MIAVPPQGYNFPSGFHPSGKSFISSLLRLKPQDRLGSNRADSDIKNHIFFNKIAWANLYQQIAPPIKQYLPPSEDSSSLDGALEPIAINQAADNQSPDSNRSAIDDASGQGIPFVLPKDEYDSLLKDQSVNRKNVAHKWKDFVENELIIKMGYMEKKRGFFPRKRMFLLTGKNETSVACPVNQAVDFLVKIRQPESWVMQPVFNLPHSGFHCFLVDHALYFDSKA